MGICSGYLQFAPPGPIPHRLLGLRDQLTWVNPTDRLHALWLQVVTRQWAAPAGAWRKRRVRSGYFSPLVSFLRRLVDSQSEVKPKVSAPLRRLLQDPLFLGPNKHSLDDGLYVTHSPLGFSSLAFPFLCNPLFVHRFECALSSQLELGLTQHQRLSGQTEQR